MDGYLHHMQKKRDLQVSNGKTNEGERGIEKARGGKGRADRRRNAVIYICICTKCRCVLSANNNILWLGCK